MKDTPEQRFNTRYEESSSGCWEWVGAIVTGYGQIQIDGKKVYAHRLSWALHNGPVPEGMMVLHRCDNRKCVNPDHLFIGDQAANMADRNNKQRQARGEAISQGKLTADAVRNIRRYYAAGGCTKQWLAIVYGVSKESVRCIITGETWRHLS